MWFDSRTYLWSKPVEDKMTTKLIKNETWTLLENTKASKVDSSRDVHIEGFTSQQPDGECIPLKLHRKIEQYHCLHSWIKPSQFDLFSNVLIPPAIHIYNHITSTNKLILPGNQNVHKIYILFQVLRSNQSWLNLLPLQICDHMSGVSTNLQQYSLKEVKQICSNAIAKSSKAHNFVHN